METETPSTPESVARHKVYNNESTPPFVVPPTPLMTKIGWGTGVSVYHVYRSPRFGQERSPWVVKKRNAKFQRGSISDRLLREADILRTLNHPNIVGFRGFTKSADGREVLVMEECTQSLGDFIERHGKDFGQFPRKTVLEVMLGICKGLHYLHTEKRLIHGDIKSFNVLIKGAFESIKLCDFGVSLTLDEDGISKEEYVGSLPWTAPEALVDGPITDRVDMFAAGLTLYEMLAMKTPHLPELDDSYLDKTMDSDMMEASMEEPPYGTRAVLPEMSSNYSDIIVLYNWLTEEDYRRRPSAMDVIETIESLTSSNGILEV